MTRTGRAGRWSAPYRAVRLPLASPADATSRRSEVRLAAAAKSSSSTSAKSSSSGQRAVHRRLGDLVDLRQFGLRLALGIACGGDTALLWRQLDLAAELRALGPGALDAFLAASADQAALKLIDAAQDRDQQPANRGRGVAPALAEADEATAPLIKIVQDVGQVAGDRARRSSLAT